MCLGPLPRLLRFLSGAMVGIRQPHSYLHIQQRSYSSARAHHPMLRWRQMRGSIPSNRFRPAWCILAYTDPQSTWCERSCSGKFNVHVDMVRFASPCHFMFERSLLVVLFELQRHLKMRCSFRPGTFLGCGGTRSTSPRKEGCSCAGSL